MQAAPTEIRTKPKPHCLLCGTAGEILYRDLPDPSFGASGLWQVKKCPRNGCGLMWLDPAPVEEDLHLAYQTYFTHGSEDGKPGFGSRLRAALYRVYRAAHYPPAALTGLSAAKKRLSRMFLDDLKPGRVLDVGCGDGMFLDRMRRLGWSVEGVDFDPKAITNAKLKYGLDLRQGDLRSAQFPDDSFAAITMSHVIEHVPDPVALLAEARRILKPGGRLVVTTPNAGSFGQDKFQANWFGLDPPRHLQVFTLNTLGECARRAGFKEARTASTAANADIFIGGSYSIRSAGGRRADSHPRPNLTRTLKAVILQYREHARIRTQPECGEEAVLICVKEAG